MKTKTDLMRDLAFVLEMNGFEHYIDINSLELISLPRDEAWDILYYPCFTFSITGDKLKQDKKLNWSN